MIPKLIKNKIRRAMGQFSNCFVFLKYWVFCQDSHIVIGMVVYNDLYSNDPKGCIHYSNNFFKHAKNSVSPLMSFVSPFFTLRHILITIFLNSWNLKKLKLLTPKMLVSHNSCNFAWTVSTLIWNYFFVRNVGTRILNRLRRRVENRELSDEEGTH